MDCLPHAGSSPKTLRADSSARLGMTRRCVLLEGDAGLFHVVSRVRPRKAAWRDGLDPRTLLAWPCFTTAARGCCSLAVGLEAVEFNAGGQRAFVFRQWPRRPFIFPF